MTVIDDSDSTIKGGVMLAILLMVAQAGGDHTTVEDYTTSDSPKAVLYRSTNSWTTCAIEIGQQMIKKYPQFAYTPTVVGEAAADACKDERAAFHALALVFFGAERSAAGPEAQTAEFEARIRTGIVDRVAKSINARAHR
jgi:hypothetical protein